MTWQKKSALVLAAIAVSAVVFWLLGGTFTPLTIASTIATPTLAVLAVLLVREKVAERHKARRRTREVTLV